jgi:hypothetical protein
MNGLYQLATLIRVLEVMGTIVSWNTDHQPMLLSLFFLFIHFSLFYSAALCVVHRQKQSNSARKIVSEQSL